MGRIKLKEKDTAFPITVYVTESDIANDNGVKKYIDSMNKAMNRRIKNRKSKKS